MNWQITVQQKRFIYFSVLDFWIVLYSSKGSEITNSTCIFLDWFSQTLNRDLDSSWRDGENPSSQSASRNFIFLADKKIDGVQSNYSQKH